MKESRCNVPHTKCSNRIAKGAAFFAGGARSPRHIYDRKSRELSVFILDLTSAWSTVLNIPQVAGSPRPAKSRRCPKFPSWTLQDHLFTSAFDIRCDTTAILSWSRRHSSFPGHESDVLDCKQYLPASVEDDPNRLSLQLLACSGMTIITMLR